MYWLTVNAMKTASMKTIARGGVCLLMIVMILLFAHLRDLGDQYGVVDYFTSSVSNTVRKQPYHARPAGNTVGDKIIVMAKMEHEDTSWVAEELPE